MSTQVTLTLPDETYRRAKHLAQLTGRTIADVLADTIDISLQPLGAEYIVGKAVSELSNIELLALADSQMESAQDDRLSELLHKQQAGQLLSTERSELLALMQIYQEGLLRKAKALNEAVRRGLRKPLEP
jgi:predicted DNA-binding protein